MNLPWGNEVVPGQCKSSCEREVTLAPGQSLPWGSSLSRVHVNRPLEFIGPIDILREILQGDSFCVTSFIMGLNLVAWYLRSTEGYKMSTMKGKITHLMFVRG